MALPFFGIGKKTDVFQSCNHCWLFQIVYYSQLANTKDTEEVSKVDQEKTHISYDNNIILKIFQVGFSSTLTKNVQMYKLGLEEAEEPEIKLSTSVGS